MTEFYQPYETYEHYSSCGVLLYVGVSIHSQNRFLAHKQANWFPFVSCVKVTIHKSKDAALSAEKFAIQTLMPKCNRTHARHNRGIDRFACLKNMEKANVNVSWMYRTAGDEIYFDRKTEMQKRHNRQLKEIKINARQAEKIGIPKKIAISYFKKHDVEKIPVTEIFEDLYDFVDLSIFGQTISASYASGAVRR